MKLPFLNFCKHKPIEYVHDDCGGQVTLEELSGIHPLGWYCWKCYKIWEFLSPPIGISDNSGRPMEESAADFTVVGSGGTSFL